MQIALKEPFILRYSDILRRICSFFFWKVFSTYCHWFARKWYKSPHFCKTALVFRSFLNGIDRNCYRIDFIETEIRGSFGNLTPNGFLSMNIKFDCKKSRKEYVKSYRAGHLLREKLDFMVYFFSMRFMLL